MGLLSSSHNYMSSTGHSISVFPTLGVLIVSAVVSIAIPQQPTHAGE
jgi:hypothetical protein